jgi:hypothetical protein
VSVLIGIVLVPLVACVLAYLAYLGRPTLYLWLAYREWELTDRYLKAETDHDLDDEIRHLLESATVDDLEPSSGYEESSSHPPV